MLLLHNNCPSNVVRRGASGSGAQGQDLEPQRQTRDFKARSDIFSLALLSMLWIVMSTLANPIGDFPLNDDWVFALGVKSILQTGRFELPSTGAPNVFAQAYWGALFCLPFGFSFTALRFSTLTLGWAGIVAFYLLLREIGGSRWIALLGSLALAVNPLYFGLAHTFMTDVPFLAVVITALWLFVRGIRREQAVSLSAGIGIALLAILIRQFALLLLLAFGVAYVMRRGVTWKAFVVAIVPVVVGAGLHLMYQHWMVETGRKPFFELASLRNLNPTPVSAFFRHSLRVPLSLPYLGFFLAPFLAFVASPETYSAGGGPRLRISLFVVVLAGILAVAIYAVFTPVPEFGHILTPSGLGPRTLRDTFLLGQNFPAIPASFRILWIGGIIVGALGAVVLVLYFVQTIAQVISRLWQPDRRAAMWVEALTLVFVCAYGSLLLLVSFGFKSPLFDRYLLLIVPTLFVLILTSEIRLGSIRVVRWRGALSLALIIIYAAISVAATHDYLAWNRTRWIATGMLMQSGVLPNHIDGGYEFNGWYLSDIHHKRAPDKSGWWVDDDEYIIASGPLSGYRELQRIHFQRWLPLADASVVVLHRAEPESR